MKLKGKNSENLSSEDRARKERTLERMTKVREENADISRKVIETKLQWAQAEKEKGMKILSKLTQEIDKIKYQLQQLDGAIATLTDLLVIKPEEPTAEPESKPQ